MKLNTSEKKIFNQRGYSIGELTISIALLSIAGLIVASTNNLIQKVMSTALKEAQVKTDNIYGEAMIAKDIKESGLSFNNMKYPDDSNLNFFDYNPEINSTPSQNNNPDRKLTLSAEKRVDLVFTVTDQQAGPLMIINPMTSYTLGEIPSDPNKPARLTYIGINANDYIKKNRINFWKEGQAFLLDTQSRIRTQSTDQTMTMRVAAPSRSSVFIGYVKSETDLDLTTLLTTKKVKNLFFGSKTIIIGNEITSTFNLTHPEDIYQTEKSINLNTDQFFRTVTSQGGGIPVIRMHPVKLVRYSIENENKSSKLFREVYDVKLSKWVRKTLVFDHVDKVEFVRNSLGSRLIDFKIYNKIR